MTERGPSRRDLLVLGALGALAAGTPALARAEEEVLPSWRDGPPRRVLLDLVARVTREGGPEWLPPEERVAVFDNDGTLWSEQPMYVQAAFALDRVRALASANPAWRSTEPFRSVLEGDGAAVGQMGEKALLELVLATHAGTTTEEFESIVTAWIREARHPRYGRPYTACVFAPMLELLGHLRANGFRTFIVSGGGVEFLRPWAQQVYGVPPDQVIGSSIRTRYEVRDGRPVLLRLPELEFVDDKAGKPVGIHRFIGRRPVLAFGNSDGDFEMLEWTTSAPGSRLGLLLHHDDAEREVAYDRDSRVGRLDRGLEEAGKRGWVLVSMKEAWRTVFPPTR